MKLAETTGTNLMPYSATKRVEPSKTTVSKTAFALGSKYPLDTYHNVKQAAAYFDEYGMRFSPEDRREYCHNLVKRASELSIPVSETIRNYGADTKASPEHLKVAMDARRTVITDPGALATLDKLDRHILSTKTAEELSVAVEALAEFDKVASIDYLYDRDVPDPYASVYAEKVASWSFVAGNDVLTEDGLKYVAKAKFLVLKNTYGEDFAVEFKKDPKSIFDSLPIDQKKMISRLASDNSPGIAD